jgi:indole-3-glycerol phosphate synthase
LRKDFIIDPLQVWESRLLGADAILLIVAALSKTSLLELCAEASQAGLDVLIEVHNQEELTLLIEVIKESQASSLPEFLLGINNRNLHTFETDLDVTRALASKAKDSVLGREMVIVSESGIFNPNDAHYVYKNGAQALLIGESLVAKGDPGENLRELIEGFRKQAV